MPSKIGEAILVIKANAKGLKTGLDNAQKTVSSSNSAKWRNVSRALPGTDTDCRGRTKGTWRSCPDCQCGYRYCRGCRCRDGQENPGLGALPGYCPPWKR